MLDNWNAYLNRKKETETNINSRMSSGKLKKIHVAHLSSGLRNFKNKN